MGMVGLRVVVLCACAWAYVIAMAAGPCERSFLRYANDETWGGGGNAEHAGLWRALLENPRDLIANYLLTSVDHFSLSTRNFTAAYLLSHGVIKLWLIIGLLRGNRPAARLELHHALELGGASAHRVQRDLERTVAALIGDRLEGEGFGERARLHGEPARQQRGAAIRQLQPDVVRRRRERERHQGGDRPVRLDRGA